MCDTGLQEERRQFNEKIEQQAQEIARIEGLLEAQRTETFKAVEREHAAKKTIQEQAQEIARLQEALKKLNRTVAEDETALDAECKRKAQTIQTLREALARLHNDSTASDFNEHWDSCQQAQRVLEETR